MCPWVYIHIYVRRKGTVYAFTYRIWRAHNIPQILIVVFYVIAHHVLKNVTDVKYVAAVGLIFKTPDS